MWWLGAKSSRERERRGREGDSAQKSQITGLGETVGPRRVTGRNPGPQLSMSKWKGTGIKVWPCVKMQSAPLGGTMFVRKREQARKGAETQKENWGSQEGRESFCEVPLENCVEPSLTQP